MKAQRLKTKQVIEPFAVYTTVEAAKILNVNPQAIRNNREALGARRLGKSYTFLGENLLAYLGSATHGEKQEEKKVDTAGAATIDS